MMALISAKCDRLSMNLDLTQVLQLIDKTPEPKSIQVHTRNRSHR